MNDTATNHTPSDNTKSASEIIKDFHQKLIIHFNSQIQVKDGELEEQEQRLVHTLNILCSNINATTNDEHLGQWLVSTLVAGFPALMPLLPRDLLWYFGGECLHFMEDMELERFQTLEEQFYELAHSKNVSEEDYASLRKAIFGATFEINPSPAHSSSPKPH